VGSFFIFKDFDNLACILLSCLSKSLKIKHVSVIACFLMDHEKVRTTAR